MRVCCPKLVVPGIPRGLYPEIIPADIWYVFLHYTHPFHSIEALCRGFLLTIYHKHFPVIKILFKEHDLVSLKDQALNCICRVLSSSCFYPSGSL